VLFVSYFFLLHIVKPPCGGSRGRLGVPSEIQRCRRILLLDGWHSKASCPERPEQLSGNAAFLNPFCMVGEDRYGSIILLPLLRVS